MSEIIDQINERKHGMASWCKVVIKDGHQFVIMPSGERIPAIIWTRVFDGIHPGEAYAILKVRVNLTESPLEITLKNQ